MNKIFKSMMAMTITAFTFTACEDVPEPYNNPYDSIKGNEPVVVDPKGSGTAEDPWNVTALLNACEGLAANEFLKINGEDATVYVTGIVVATTEVSTQYGNATYTIADDKNGVAQFLVFRGKLLNGANVTAETDLEVGDEVTVCGKVKNYVKDGNSTLEFDQGNYLVSLKKGDGSGSTDTPDVKTVGSKDAPKTVAEALTAVDAMANGATSEEYWFIKGKVKQIITAADKISQYKNIDYLITDDGNNEIKVFRGKNLDNTDFTSADQLAVDDEVVVYGQLLKYEDTKNDKIVPEVAQGNYIVKKSSNSGNNNDDVNAQAVTVAEFNAAAESTDVWYKLTGTIKNLRAGDQFGNFDLEDASGSVYVYGLLSEKGGEKKKFQDLVTKYNLQEGTTITIIGNRGSYNDKIEVLNAYLVSVGGDNNDNGGNGDATLLTNGNFETWAEGLPTGWKSASTASSATLEQSTDAHGGSYSVNVKGNESSNKRLASQEITLEAGTYTFSFWAKATTSDVSQARPGYVPVTEGTAGSYSYGDYATLSTSWQQISYEFTLSAQTTICLVVMNPKKSNYSSGKDILIDDATLTKN